MHSLKFLGISGSLRKCSRNSGLLRAACAALPAGVEMTTVDLSAVPFYNADIADGPKPPAVATIFERMQTADAFVLACPEYNYSLAPALKNIIDWASREPENRLLAGKPAAIMGAGGGMGTGRAQYHLRQVCVYLDMHPLNKPEVFSNAFGSDFAASGDVASPKLQARVAELMAALAAWTRRLQA